MQDRSLGDSWDALVETSSKYHERSLTQKLLHGETTCLSVSPIFYVNEDCDILTGSLHLTNFRMFFNEVSEEKRRLSLQIPLFLIGTVECGKNEPAHKKLGSAQFFIHLQLKDSLNYRFLLDSLSPERFVAILRELRFPQGLSAKFFPFKHHFVLPSDVVDGWTVYDVREEAERIGLGRSTGWRLSALNLDFQLCPSYPQYLVVPDGITDERLMSAASFRGQRRLPVVVWRHANGAVIARCAQPMPGLTSRRDGDDEMLVEAIRRSSGGQALYIYDLRSKTSAWANRAKGGGYEDTAIYNSTIIKFMNIANIHSIRDSLQRYSILHRQSKLKDSQWFAQLDVSQWFTHLSSLLRAAIEMANDVDNGHSVLVHCSDGWDRTAQVSSLAQILLDPFYRSYRGIQVLIEKEWLSMGHQFTKRCGLTTTMVDHDYCPIFYQWLDCINQLMHQAPTSFEFNEEFLLQIVDQLWTCRFGTFIGNCDKERIEMNVRNCTLSLWTYLNFFECFDNETGLASRKVEGHIYPVPERFRNLIFKPFDSPLLSLAWTLHSLEPFSLIIPRCYGRIPTSALFSKTILEKDAELRELRLSHERQLREKEIELQQERNLRLRLLADRMSEHMRMGEQLKSYQDQLADVSSYIHPELARCQHVVADDVTLRDIEWPTIIEDYLDICDELEPIVSVYDASGIESLDLSSLSSPL